jgi:hypothetical protein
MEKPWQNQGAQSQCDGHFLEVGSSSDHLEEKVYGLNSLNVCVMLNSNGSALDSCAKDFLLQTRVTNCKHEMQSRVCLMCVIM